MLLAKPDTASLALVEEYVHRAVNEYAVAVAALHLAARDVGDESACRYLRDAANRLRAVAQAHRALAMPAPGECCNLGEYLTGVCSALADALLNGTRLRLDLQSSTVVLSRDHCWRLALIIAELVHNAARHGDQRNEIIVELAAMGSDLVCRVSNDGPCSVAPAAGRGRQIVEALAEELGGTANWVFTAAGASACVVVPSAPPGG